MATSSRQKSIIVSFMILLNVDDIVLNTCVVFMRRLDKTLLVGGGDRALYDPSDCNQIKTDAAAEEVGRQTFLCSCTKGMA